VTIGQSPQACKKIKNTMYSVLLVDNPPKLQKWVKPIYFMIRQSCVDGVMCVHVCLSQCEWSGDELWLQYK